VRTYVMTGEARYEQMYWDILAIRDGQKARPIRYENVYWDFMASTNKKPRPDGQKISLLEMMKDLGFTQEELARLAQAETHSNDLVRIEEIAMHAIKGEFLDPGGKFTVKRESDRDYARTILYDASYHRAKVDIMTPIDEVFVMVNARTEAKVNRDTVYTYVSISLVFVTTILLFWMSRAELNQRKQAEEALQASEEKYREFVEGTGDLITRVDNEGRFIYINHMGEKVYGVTQDKYLGMLAFQFIHHDDQVATERWFRGCVANHVEQASFENRQVNQVTGAVSCMLWTCNFHYSQKNQITGVNSIAHDITGRKRVEKELQQSEAKYKSLFKNMQNGFALHEMVFDETGKPIDYIFLDVNEAFEKQTTLKRENTIGRKVTEVLPGIKNDPADWIDIYGGVVLTGNCFSFENYSELLTKWYSIVAYRPNKGQFATVFSDITERKQAEQELHETRVQLKSLASELVLAEEQERNRIAVHLHDDVSQSLAYVKMKLQVVNAALSDQALTKDMTDVCDTLTGMMQEVHSLTFELSTPVLTELGLEKAISHWLQEQIEEKHGIATEFTDDGQAKPLAKDIQALLFRSVRELLVNVVKHSKAKQVKISISSVKDQILIHLEDDGIGFAPDKVVVGKNRGGFGLFSIRERLSYLGGSLEIDSSPGQGCRSVLKAPLQQS